MEERQKEPESGSLLQEPNYGNLSQLPNELLYLIFGFLPPRDEMNLRLVNKSLLPFVEDIAEPMIIEAKIRYDTLIEKADQLNQIKMGAIDIELIKSARSEFLEAIFRILQSNESQRAVDILFFKLIRVCKITPFKARLLIERMLYNPSDAAISKATSAASREARKRTARRNRTRQGRKDTEIWEDVDL
jgi:hypothetical protein